MGKIRPGRRRQFEVIEVDKPTPDDLGPNDVLVDIKRAMVCNTDKEMASTAGQAASTSVIGYRC
jgi:threonine dehydrogenase-like Zn-dependent dehydrogenase